MAKFLTTRGTIAEIENIINNAQKSIVLISPYVKIPLNLFQNIVSADKKGIHTIIICREKDLQSDVLEQFKQLKNVKVNFLDNIHAKCYFNEQSMVISSLNLYDFSEQSNVEIGVLLTIQDDKLAFTEGLQEAKRIFDVIKQQSLTHTNGTNSNISIRNKVPAKEAKEDIGSAILRTFSNILSDAIGLKEGYCIGCQTRIEYGDKKPFCSECYKEWAKQKWQKAKYCHACGQLETTSINRPLCLSCYKDSKS